MSGWGLKFFDNDNDGKLDLFTANGHADELIDKISPGVAYSEPLLLFKNVGRKTQERQQREPVGFYAATFSEGTGDRRFRQ